MKDVITIYFDGGCRPTNPGNKYGSYEVTLAGKQIGAVNRQELGWGTNNEAEFEILILALNWTVKQLLAEELCPSDFRVVVVTDSTIVRNRINGQNKTNKGEAQRRMFSRNAGCLKWLRMFSSFTAEWRSRFENVARFGH
jgi:ribonuclease HI